ncbi:MAG: hypothetical protein K2K92_09005 [Duncaniella sp.]|nr:hypothetical protein [Duncaniella sp.]
MSSSLTLFLRFSVILVAFLVSSPSVRAGQEKPEGDAPVRFIWGAEIGPGIDMGGDDMSTLNLGAMMGLRCPYLSVAGIGAGINMMISNSCRYFPVYAIARSSFSRNPRLFFMEMRAGIAFNQAVGIPDRTNLYLQPGGGIHLATGKTFASYLMLSYVYNSMTFYGDRNNSLVHGLNQATITLGVTF